MTRTYTYVVVAFVVDTPSNALVLLIVLATTLLSQSSTKKQFSFGCK